MRGKTVDVLIFQRVGLAWWKNVFQCFFLFSDKLCANTPSEANQSPFSILKIVLGCPCLHAISSTNSPWLYFIISPCCEVEVGAASRVAGHPGEGRLARGLRGCPVLGWYWGFGASPHCWPLNEGRNWESSRSLMNHRVFSMSFVALNASVSHYLWHIQTEELACLDSGEAISAAGLGHCGTNPTHCTATPNGMCWHIPPSCWEAARSPPRPKLKPFAALHKLIPLNGSCCFSSALEPTLEDKVVPGS